ncbi:hypothetical protein BJF78_30605 [Pseudonocardia sp. CNS-139]|nr:hypothetical protein BJF78_30605 [Pseudonocardia sp. CNS-139]
MSYDLAVYTRERTDLVGTIRSIPTLDIGEDGAADSGLVAVRAADRAYLFDAGGPDALDPEDVPDEVADVHSGVVWRYWVTVEGSGDAGSRAAVRFARALARAAGGAVLDQTTGVWVDGRTHRPRRSRERRLDVVTLRWYALRGARPDDLGARWLEQCRRHLPSALPRRFGPVEPMAHKLATDGDDGFAEVLAGTEGLLFLAGTPPFLGGSLTGGGARRRFGPVEVHTATVDRATPAGPMRDLLVGVAEAVGCFFASAEVQRNLAWTGRSLYLDEGAEHDVYLAPRGEWLGLPPRPVAWSWYGPAYAPLVRDGLPGAEPAAGGLLHRWRPEPADRDEIAASTPWLRPDLLAREEETAFGSAHLERAARVPRLGRRRWWPWR